MSESKQSKYPKAKRSKPFKVVEAITHGGYAKRKNLPSVELQPVMQKQELQPVKVSYKRGSQGLGEEKQDRNADLDPQLVWRGKDQQDWSDLVVTAPPLYIQEKVHPKALIDDLRKRSAQNGQAAQDQPDLFADFNGVAEGADKYDFYQHDGKWQNRMILGDSLQVMASLAEREGLRGQVQCIYIDPPYGIKFNSNFQWSTTSRDVKDGKMEHITREPEMVKAFRDTWRDGIHSYLTYLRDRLMVGRDLLHESGSMFVQIGDENVHRVRAVMDDVFGECNFVAAICFVKTSSATSEYIPGAVDYLLWFARSIKQLKFRPVRFRSVGDRVGYKWLRWDDGTSRAMTANEIEGTQPVPSGANVYQPDNLTSQSGGESTRFEVHLMGRTFHHGSGGWKTNNTGMRRLNQAGRIHLAKNSLRYVRYENDFAVKTASNMWSDTATGNFTERKIYVVQTAQKVIERCILMASDPGDLLLDPTCGSGTTAYVSEQWGRRWITIDTSRVALALARGRIMGARYPFYLLADSEEGQRMEAALQEKDYIHKNTFSNVRHGFVNERIPHITLRSIANNAEIDVIWEKWQETLEPLLARLNAALAENWEEWQIPREAENGWPSEAIELHAAWWDARISRQKEIDASIAANADTEHLYDKPYEDKKKVRVAGPFTVESLSPHRALAMDENDELLDPAGKAAREEEQDFVHTMLEELRIAGVHQAHREDRIAFEALKPWPGHYICAEGTYLEGGATRRAGIFIGPEFGTVPRPDLVAAAREAGDADFDVLIACAFNYEALSTEFDKLGRIPVLKARINADLHMSAELKNTGKGNLFVIFGEPDIDILDAEDGQVMVRLNGVDVFKPNEGKVQSSSPDEIACWFIDTDYDEESFFARHAYFLGANDPYKALKTTLKAEIDEDAWASLHSNVSRPFDKPESGRIAVKVINHLGDEVMKVFRVE